MNSANGLGSPSSLLEDFDPQVLQLLKRLIPSPDEKYDPTIVRTGDKVILPEGASLPDVISALQRQHRNEEQIANISVTLPVPPWDGAMALVAAVSATLGPVTVGCTCGNPECGVRKIDVMTGVNESIQVPWGMMSLPGMEGAHASMDTTEDDGRLIFQVNIQCKRKYEERIRRLLDSVREHALQHSLHKGKAFSIEFYDDDGDTIAMPKPKFFDLGTQTPIFNDDLQKAIDRNIFVPIRHTLEMARMGESLKKGVLAAGIFGVGKTLLANQVARVATENGWTFIYVMQSDELAEALQFARLYEPAVVFCEDVDRIAGEDRDEDVNELMNVLDGIDGKTSRVITILTTNDPEKINPGMRRPGRIDVVLDIKAPNAKTVEIMVRNFAADALDPNADLTEVGTKLDGKIPACIREAVRRARLEALRRTGSADAKITTDDLLATAEEVVNEDNLFRPAAKDEHPSVAAFGRGLRAAGDVLLSGTNGSPAHATAHH